MNPTLFRENSMNSYFTYFKCTVLLMALAGMGSPAVAGPGHDHGDEAAAATGGAALPRFTAVSELFELVGVLNGRQLTLYLDRSDTNAPVKDAKLEIEFAGAPLKLEPQGPGEFSVTLAAAPKPGVIPVTATVIAGTETDLLAGNFDLHDSHADAKAAALHGWKRYVPWIAGGGVMLVLAALGVAWRRRRMLRALPSLVCAAVCLAFASAAMTGPAYAGPGHDHGDAPPAAGSGPKRLPDGSVFLPKPAQRQIGVRTTPASAASELPRTFELAGKVVMDPNAGGRVQPTQAGRIEPGPRGFPSVGHAVKKGDVLAYVAPSVGSMERSNQAAQLAELRSAKGLAEKRVVRLRELADTVPRKDIEAAEAEAASLTERIAAIGGGLAAREALMAPVAGVIASAHAVSGQVVDARELVFEIVDPARLRIEAMAYDAEIAAGIASATLALGAERVPLRFIGAARILREQALPMLFQVEGAVLGKLAVGQSVRVYVQTTRKITGVSVAAAALMKNPANQAVVWVKTAPERFEPRVVITEALDGVSVAVTSGLKAGDRVVIEAGTLINQIR